MQWFPQGAGYKLLHLADFDILHLGKGLIPTADLVLSTSQVVADEVAPATSARTINIGHALDARWLEGLASLADRPARTPRHVVFAGQLATRYNDWEGFAEITARHPELRFTFIGPYDDDFPDPAFQALRKRDASLLQGSSSGICLRKWSRRAASPSSWAHSALSGSKE